MREALAVRQAKGTIFLQPYYLALLAQAHVDAGEISEAAELLSEALDRAESTREIWIEAELHRLKGEVLLSRADRAKAEARFKQAIDIAQAQSAKSWELRAATSLARLWAEQGERRKAHDLLAPIHGWFTEGFDTADLMDAKALLAELA
jgi:predicted ATPase